MEIKRGCPKPLNLAIFWFRMTCKLLIFNDAKNAIIHHLDFSDRLSRFMQFKNCGRKNKTMM